MTIEEVIEHLCQTTALIYHSIGDYREASDGFCNKCLKANMICSNDYRHSGKTLRYMREAVVEKLKKDGYKIDKGFDNETGDEIQVAKAEGDR